MRLGSKVRHSKFGDGHITDISGGHVVIDFKNIGNKILGLDVCVAKGYLKIIEIGAIPEEEKAEVLEVMSAIEDEMDQTQSAEQITDTKSISGWFGKLLSALFKRGK